MNPDDFDGTLVLEHLARVGLVDELADAVDADDFDRARQVMRSAGVDPDMIANVLRMMRDAER
jgi:hypothetical protein